MTVVLGRCHLRVHNSIVFLKQIQHHQHSSPSTHYHPFFHLPTTSKAKPINMQFSTIVVALAASASAAVLPRSYMGSWDVQITTGPEERLYLTAQFKSDSYPGDDYLRSACVEAPHATLPVAHRCDRAAFDFVYDGKSKLRM
jgi:hypothetical protein